MSDLTPDSEAERTAADTHQGPITRQALYELVWAEPMLKVAARFEVSSSYMARVCTALNVPRPERGYWAKLAVGKGPAQPALPVPGPGDLLEWTRGGEFAYRPPRRARPRIEVARRAKPERKADPATDRHRLVIGAKELFEAGRESWTVGYLKPTKRLLVDLTVSKSALEKALDFANQLFIALENGGYPVAFAAPGEYCERAEVDIREAPAKTPPAHENLWYPARCTVAQVKGVQFGLTIIEMAEHVEVRYVNGKYVRLRDYVAPKRGRYRVDQGWTSRRDMPSGRLCLQAYSPYSGTEWKQVWRETPEGPLAARIPSIIRELARAVPEVLRQVDAAERAAEARQREWDEQLARWHRRQAEERAAKALKDSTDQLLAIIEEWASATRLTAFFDDARSRIEGLPETERGALLVRLARAQDLIGTTDTVTRFTEWRSPEER